MNSPSYEENLDHRNDKAGATVLAAETLRAGAHLPYLAKSKGEEGMTLFWRVCGGTLLSIAGLVVITLYNQINGS